MEGWAVSGWVREIMGRSRGIEVEGVFCRDGIRFRSLGLDGRYVTNNDISK